MRCVTTKDFDKKHPEHLAVAKQVAHRLSGKKPSDFRTALHGFQHERCAGYHMFIQPLGHDANNRLVVGVVGDMAVVLGIIHEDKSHSNQAHKGNTSTHRHLVVLAQTLDRFRDNPEAFTGTDVTEKPAAAKGSKDPEEGRKLAEKFAARERRGEAVRS